MHAHARPHTHNTYENKSAPRIRTRASEHEHTDILRYTCVCVCANTITRAIKYAHPGLGAGVLVSFTSVGRLVGRRANAIPARRAKAKKAQAAAFRAAAIHASPDRQCYRAVGCQVIHPAVAAACSAAAIDHHSAGRRGGVRRHSSRTMRPRSPCCYSLPAPEPPWPTWSPSSTPTRRHMTSR